MPDEGLPPRILSPNLGCPEIVSPEALHTAGITIVLALDLTENPARQSYNLRARPSYQAQGTEFPLTLGGLQELDDDALPEAVNDVSQTRLLISTMLRCGIFQGRARFWSLRARAQEELDAEHLREANGGRRATLYDLALYRGDTFICDVKHALCLRPPSPVVRFVHLTDLHVAARNDLWKEEVKSILYPVPAGATLQFTNFNDRLRRFIQHANGLADAGQLDFVLALGDLVDFVQHGIREADPGSNNWQVVLEILVGSPAELARGNRGLRVPVFTTLGNHDWRPYPYPPEVNARIFHLNEKEAEQLNYLYYDSSEAVGKRIAEVHSKLIAEGSPVLARTWWHSAVGSILRGSELALDRISTRLSALAGGYLRAALTSVITAVITGHGALALYRGKVPSFRLVGYELLFFLVLVGLFLAFRDKVGDALRHKITALLSIETSADTLRDYFLRINPYFNYAIRVENCYFLIVDTGYDCLTGQSFWDDGGKKLGPISVRDNIIGGSPDTMAFFPPNQYYHYSQIAWLEAVLGHIRQTHEQNAGLLRRCRVFVCVHTPPANLSKGDRRRADDLLAAAGGNPVPMERKTFGGFDVRYGTINHYLSQFYYLCLGYRETNQQNPSGPGVDVVLAGHAHWSIEFRLGRPANAGAAWDPQVNYGKFSEMVEQHPDPPHEWWGPLLLQTGACGPPSDTDPDTPNFRYITVDGQLRIRTLRPVHL